VLLSFSFNIQYTELYKSIISENHKLVVEQIKDSIERLIVQLQSREEWLLIEANKWKQNQIL
jgi:hypothetical protein